MYEIYFDGACAPINPNGTASYGWLIKKDGKVLKTGCGVVGKGQGMTNNLAEYWGVLEGVKAFTGLKLKTELKICGDSNMVCQMVARKWGWKKNEWNPHPNFPHLRDILEQVHALLEDVDYEVEWIPREKNTEADELSKKPLVELGIVDVTSEVKMCPECKTGKMLKRKGKFGSFWGCSNYPKCRNTQKPDEE